MVKIDNDLNDHDQYYPEKDQFKGHTKTNSSNTDNYNSSRSVKSIPISPISNRRDSLTGFQLQFADNLMSPQLGTNVNNQSLVRNYSLYPPNQPTSPYDYGMRSSQFQQGHSRSSSHGLGLLPPHSTGTISSNVYLKNPAMIPSGTVNQQNLGFPDSQYVNQTHQPLDQTYTHKRGNSGNSVGSRNGLNDLWTPNTAFSFPPKSPQLQIPQLTSNISDTPHKRVKSVDKISKVNKRSPNKLSIREFPQYLNPFPVQSQQQQQQQQQQQHLSTSRNFNMEEAQRQYLAFYGNALHVLKGLLGLENVCDDIERFAYFIKNDEQMKRFMAMERQKDVIGGIDPDTYSVEEFYKYLRMFPKTELINLRSIFHSTQLIIDDWLKIEEEQERAQIPLNKWINLVNSDDFNTTNQSISLDFDDSLIHGETSALRSSVSKPMYKWTDSSTIPGESVSMQVEPVRVKDYISQPGLYPKGMLQPDLSFKAKTICLQCGSEKTPEWRKGPESVRTLCNACGLFYNKLTKKYGAIEAEEELERRKRDGEPTNRKLYLQTEIDQ